MRVNVLAVMRESLERPNKPLVRAITSPLNEHRGGEAEDCRESIHIIAF